MSFDLMKIFHEMDWMARSICIALLAMGVASLSVFFERSITYWRSARDSRRVGGRALELLSAGEYVSLRTMAASYPASHLGRLIEAALSVFLDGRGRASPSAVAELVRREVARQHEVLGIDLRRGLSIIASVGSVAPFVGLLGTVVGIIAAFGKISETGSGGLSSVAGGISEALVVTALGLLIAIPAVLLFNRLSTRADALHQQLGTAGGQLVDHLEFFGSDVKPMAISRESAA